MKLTKIVMVVTAICMFTILAFPTTTHAIIEPGVDECSGLSTMGSWCWLYQAWLDSGTGGPWLQ